MVMVDAEYLKQIEGARKDLFDLIIAQKCAPIMLRLAFHDAGTYDAQAKTGGVNGSIRFELNSPANNGIKVAVDFCEQVKAKHPKISYADLYQLAGVVAVHATGGPIIPFIPGREDAPQSNQDNSGNLPVPTGDLNHLKTVFYRMGLNDRDIVVLSGSHTLGRANKDRSNFDGPFTPTPLKFDNDYYVELLKGDTEGLVKFPTDKALLSDSTFKNYVKIYAKDGNKFFEHYVESHKKMSELGFRK